MPPPQNKKGSTIKYGLSQAPEGSGSARLASLLIILAGLAALVLVALNIQNIQDWWRLRGYHPPAAVAQLAEQDTMNSYTRHLFYLNKPQLLGTVASFRQSCPENKDTIVLGCYHPGQNGIFIYNVQDPALAGVTQVTAAHEVLHAVYARLSTKDRAALNSQLEDYYQHGLQDPRVRAEVKLYQQTEPKDVLDEMSCTFGTEIASLPAPLEAYYKRFFDNRAAIVAFEQQYEGEFTSRQTTITADDQQLAILKQQIDTRQTGLYAQLQQINGDQNRLNGLKGSGQTIAYNALVPGYNAEVDAYNQGVSDLQATINQYNQLVAARNQVAGQLTTLAGALDTRLTTQTTR
jgi:hypothetical protein